MLTAEQIQKAKEMRETGLSYKKIATELGITSWDAWNLFNRNLEKKKKKVTKAAKDITGHKRGRPRKTAEPDAPKTDVPEPDAPKTDLWREEVRRECETLQKLILAKNKDYGSSVFQTPALTPGISVEQAILVRVGDKMQRLANIQSGCCEVDERKEDTVRDIAGYMILLLVWNKRLKTEE